MMYDNLFSCAVGENIYLLTYLLTYLITNVEMSWGTLEKNKEKHKKSLNWKNVKGGAKDF